MKRYGEQLLDYPRTNSALAKGVLKVNLASC